MQLVDLDGAALLELRERLLKTASHSGDVLVYAINVCDATAMARAVREHVNRCPDEAVGRARA